MRYSFCSAFIQAKQNPPRIYIYIYIYKKVLLAYARPDHQRVTFCSIPRTAIKIKCTQKMWLVNIDLHASKNHIHISIISDVHI